MTTAQTDLETAGHLRSARERAGMTLTQAAAISNLSVTHLSRLERGLRQPSIGVMRQLAASYGIGIGELVGESAQTASKIMRRNDFRRVVETEGARPYTTLTGLAGHTGLGVVRMTISDTAEPIERRQHYDEEFLYIESGTLVLDLNGQAITLEAGDSIHFDARIPHCMRSSVDGEAVVLVVCSPIRSNPAAHH